MEKGFIKEEAALCLDLILQVNDGYEGVWAIMQSLGSFFIVIDKVNENSYILIMRGTEPKKIYDLFVDIAVFGKSTFPIPLNTSLDPVVSTGITLQYQAVAKKIFEFLNTLPQGCDLLLTGHSQAGAAVSLLGIGVEYTFAKKFNIKTYAFAPPAIGNVDYKTLAEEASPYGLFRIVNPLDVVPYFYGNILYIIKNNVPVKTPFYFKLVYYFTYTVHKLTKHQYVNVGTTVLLLEKELIHCDDTSLKKMLKYECEVLKHHGAEHYKVLFNETDLI